MTDVFKELAIRLDELPQGFPATDDGVEIDILKKIFSPDEAETALKLKSIPETLDTISERLGIPTEEMMSKLDTMSKKGQIGRFKFSGVEVYMLMPFVVGIYEFQLYRIDKELAELFERYFPTLLKTIGGFEPAMARVVPINTEIKGESQILPYEDIRGLIESANAFHLMDCICRIEKGLVGSPCKHPLEVCLAFSRDESAYDGFTLGGRKITKDEALGVLDISEESGLVHNLFYNTMKGQFAVCNCCPCCCGLIRGMKEFDSPHMIARSNYVARIDTDSCSSCGICAEERCPVDAISVENDVYEVIPERCIGCGVCSITCPTEAIIIEERPEDEKNMPSENFIDWLLTRAKNRGVELKFD